MHLGHLQGFCSRNTSGFLAPRSPPGLHTSRSVGFLWGQRSGVVRAKLIVVVVIVVVVLVILVVVIVCLVVPAALTAHRATAIDQACDPAGLAWVGRARAIDDRVGIKTFYSATLTRSRFQVVQEGRRRCRLCAPRRATSFFKVSARAGKKVSMGRPVGFISFAACIDGDAAHTFRHRDRAYAIWLLMVQSSGSRAAAANPREPAGSALAEKFGS